MRVPSSTFSPAETPEVAGAPGMNTSSLSGSSLTPDHYDSASAPRSSAPAQNNQEIPGLKLSAADTLKLQNRSEVLQSVVRGWTLDFGLKLAPGETWSFDEQANAINYPPQLLL